MTVNDHMTTMRAAGGPVAGMRPGETQARLAVVLVNWNRWRDTVECLESLVRADGRFHIIVVDNGSDDGSVEHLAAWAAGTEPYEPPSGPLRRLTAPPVDKPKTTDKPADTGAGAKNDKKAAKKATNGSPAQRKSRKQEPEAPAPTESRPARKPRTKKSEGEGE